MKIAVKRKDSSRKNADGKEATERKRAVTIAIPSAISIVSCALCLVIIAALVFTPFASPVGSPANLPNGGTVPALAPPGGAQDATVYATPPVATQHSRDIPEWYAPGVLNVTAFLGNCGPLQVRANPRSGVRVTTLSAVSTAGEAGITGIPQELPAEQTDEAAVRLPTDAVIDTPAARDADYIPLISSPLYPDEEGLYYDIRNQTTICFSSLAKEALTAAELQAQNSECYLMFSDPASGACVVGVREGNEDTFYLYNIYSENLSVSPLDFRQVASIEISPDKRYIAAIRMIDNHDEAILVDITEDKPQTVFISEGLAVSQKLWISPTGKYVMFRACEYGDEIVTPEGYFSMALYHVPTRTTRMLTGHFVRFINDDSALILQTPDGNAVIDTATGEDITISTALTNWQKFRVDIIHGGSRFKGFTQTAALVPLFEGVEGSIPITDASAICAADEYLYFYNNGDNFITCYSIETGESFSVDIDMGFLDEIRSIDQSREIINYCLYRSADLTGLAIWYFTEKIPDGEVVEYPREVDFGIAFRYADSLAGLKAYTDQYRDTPFDFGGDVSPYGETLKRCYTVAGEGYTSLVFVYADHSQFIAVEDYRDKTFSLYVNGDGMPWYDPPALYNGRWETEAVSTQPYRKQLDPEANQASTARLFADYAQLPPYYDYSDFYTDGVLDQQKNDDYRLAVSEQAYADNSNSFITRIYPEPPNGVAYGWDIVDRSDLALLIEKVSNVISFFQPQFGSEDLFPNQAGYGRCYYSVSLDVWDEYVLCFKRVFTLEIGTDKNSKPYIYTKVGFAHLDWDTYDDMLALCDRIYEKTDKQY